MGEHNSRGNGSLFGVMVHISIESRKMSGHVSYFVVKPSINYGGKFNVTLRGYVHWEKIVMTLIRFKYIRSVYYPESGEEEMETRNKFYQLHYAICRFNNRTEKLFDLGPNIAVDEGGVAIRSRYCPVRQYNKDKPTTFRVEFLC